MAAFESMSAAQVRYSAPRLYVTSWSPLQVRDVVRQQQQALQLARNSVEQVLGDVCAPLPISSPLLCCCFSVAAHVL